MSKLQVYNLQSFLERCFIDVSPELAFKSSVVQLGNSIRRLS